MKRFGTFMTTLLMLSLFLITPAFSQMRWRGNGGWGRGSQYQRMYNPSTVTTITGKVIAVDNQSPIQGMSFGVHLRLKTANSKIPVHLGPAWYLDNQDIQIGRGDQIEVRGSQVTLAGESVIIADEVRKGNQILTLRDQNGFPVWSGWRRN